MSEHSSKPKRTKRVFVFGLLVGLALPHLLLAFCDFFLITDMIGIGGAGTANQAIWAIQARDAEKALRWSNRSIAHDPMRGDGYALRSRAQELNGEYHTALADISVAIAYSQRRTKYLADRASIYQRLGLQEEAARDYARLVAGLSDKPSPRFKDLLVAFLDRGNMMGVDGIRTAVDLDRFFDSLDEEAIASPEIQRARRLLHAMLEEDQ